ncbi:MAG: enoyl-CoA hydratase/isomerase family protein [Burkholderiales bacterium]
MTQTLQVEQDGAILIVRINRPEKRNSLTVEMLDRLKSIVSSANVDDSVRAIIITGVGDCFSSGVDLTTMRDIGTSAEFMYYMDKWREVNESLESSSKPIIAAIEGYCLTGGFELALACDIRVGARGSQYGITSSKIGTVPGAGGTQRLPRIVGVSNALDMLFSSDFIDAERAREMGLLNRLVDKGQSFAAAKELAVHYATRAPLSLRYAKRAVYAGMQMPMSDAIKFEAAVVTLIYQSEDRVEGVSAFIEKRTPNFKGR